MRKTCVALAALGPAAILAALLASSLAGCTMPPYSEELSLAQITRAKLGTPVLKVGPVYTRLDEGASQDRYFFLPNRDGPATGGFLVREADYGLWLWFVTSASSYTDLGLNSFVTVDNTSQTSNNYLLQPIESGSSTSYLSLIRFSPTYMDAVLISATGPSSVTQNGVTSLSTLGLYTLGAGIFADNSSNTSDPQFFLAASGTASYQEYSCSTNTSGSPFTTPTGGATSDLGLVPDDVKNGFYVHNPNNDLSYLSIPSGATYSWTWPGPGSGPSGFQLLPGVKGRVEAVLSNGQFLTMDGNFCLLYSPAGAKLNELPLGGLKFCYERYEGGTPTLYFSLAYWHWGRDEESDELYVELYAIPTDELAGLN